MKKADQTSSASLLQKAEKFLKMNSGIEQLSQSESEMLKLIHDLTSRQAELEFQNKELSETILTFQNTNNKNLAPPETTVPQPNGENQDLIEERWKYATEDVSDGMWDWNIVTNRVFYSTQLKAMLGYSQSENGNMWDEWEKRIHPADLQLVTLELNRTLSGDTSSFSSEYRLLCKDGSYKWVSDQGKVVKRDEKGKALRAIGMHKDITAYKNIEHALKERIKELNCHNRISEVIRNVHLSINEVIEEVVRLIPAGWQFPEITQVSVQINEIVFRTPGYSKGGKNTLKSEIRANGNVIGQIEIYYEGNFNSEKQFLPEESDLLHMIAERLGSFIGEKENNLLLSESEQKYRDLVENISEVIYRIDTNGIITYISSSIEKIIGFSAEEIIGKSYNHFVGVNSEFLSQRLKELAVKKELNNEYKLFAKDGKPCWIRLSTKALFQNGNFIGANGTLINITEKKQFEQELQKSESLYRSILQASPDTIFIADLSGNVLLASPMAMKMFGYENSEVFLHRPLYDFIDPKDHEKAKEAISQMFQGEFSGSTEYVGIKSDGSKFDMDVNGEFIRDTDGNPNSLIFIARDISDKKSAEKKLHESESLYRSVLNASPDSITITDLTGKILFSSPKTVAMFRYNKPEETINRYLSDFLDEQSWAKAEHAIMQMFLGHFSGAEEYTGVRSDGSTFEIEVNADFLRGTDGKPTSIVFVTRDISDRKAAEKRLIKSEEQYRRLIESINDVVFDITIDGVINFVSPSIGKLLNCSVESLIGRNFFSFVHPEDIGFLHDVFKNNRFDEFKSIEYRYLTDNGKTIWVQASAQYSYENGIIIGRTGILHDITEKKLAEEKLRQSEEQYRKLVESVNDVIYEIDAKGTIKFVSPSVSRVLGYSIEEVLGQNIFDFIYPDDRLCLMNSLENLNARDYYYMEYRYLRKDGSIHWVRSSTSSIMKNGVLIGGTGILTDITERKSAEQKTINATRLYAVTSHVNQAIVHLRDKDKLINEICRIAIEFGKFQMAWIGFADEESKTVKPFAFAGVEDGYLSTVKQISISDVPEGNGPTGSAIREGKHFICDDIETDERMSVWRDEALKRGFRSSAALPLKQSGKIIGAFTLYASVPHYFNSEEIKLLEEIVADICFALEAIETDKDRKSAEEQYRTLVESIDEAIFEVNSEEIITYISPAVEKIGGYKPEELIGKNSLSFIYPDDIPILINALSHLGETNTPNLEYRYITKSGELCWVRTSATPIYSNGKVVGRTGSLIDINERKLAENALQDSEEKFSKAFQTAPYAISITSVEDGKFFEINDSFTVHTEYTKEEVYSDSSIGLKLWANIEDRKSVITDLSQGKDVLAKEYDFIKKSGKRVSCMYSASIILLNNKPYILSSITDISEIKQAQEQLRKLSRAVEQSPVSIVITNLDGNIEYVNPKACETTGYTHGELIGQNPRLLKSGETQATEYEGLWGNISTGNEWRGVFHNKRKNGELYWESSTISPITDPEGNITHYLAIKEDITQRKEIEEALSKSEEDLNNAQIIAQMGSWEHDLITGTLSGSKYYYTMLGLHPFEKKEMLIEYFISLIHPDDLAIFRKLQQNIYVENETKIVDFRIVLPDGKTKWLQNNILPVYEGETLVALKGVNIDITDKRQVEEALRQNEAALNQAQEISNMGSWELDMVTEKLTWSKNYHKVMGIPPGVEMENRFFLERVHPDDLHLVDEKLEEIRKTKKPVTYDLRLRMPDNEFRWIQNNIVPEFENGNLVRLKGVNIDITEKKQADEKIHLQNQRLSAIVGAMPDLMFVVDKSGTYHEYYSTNPDMLSVPDNQIIGTNLREIFDRETADLHLQKISECLKKQELITYEFSGTDKGEIKFFEIRLSSLGTDRVLTFVRDITAEKLKDNEIKKLSLAVEQSPVLIIITDLSGNIEYVNQTFETTTGYSKAELIGQNPRILKSNVTDNEVYTKMWKTITEGKQWFGELINKKKNGELYWESMSITPVRNETGKITNYLAVKQDITQRKQTEDILRQSEEKYRYMFVNNPQPMWIYDLETLAFLEVNSAAVDHYGYSRDELLAMTIKDIHPQDDVSSLMENIKLMTSDYSPASIWRHQKKNGEIINVEIVSHTITYNERNARNVLVNDITNQKRIEQEIRDLNANLEHKINERTYQLALTNADLQTQIEERSRIQDELRKSEKNYRSVVENVNEVIFKTDAKGLWLFLNKSWETVTGFSVEESLGQFFINYVHPDDRQLNMELFEPLIKKEKEYCRHVIRYITKEGGFRWIEVFARLSLTENNEVTGTFGTLQDITERKRAEDFEDELLQLSLQLTGIPGHEIPSAINMALTRIGSFLGADRAYIFELNPMDNTMSNTYEWCNDGINPEIDNLKNIPVEALPIWMEHLMRFENIIIPSVEDLPETWDLVREMLEPQGIKSLIVIPILIDIQLIGFVGLDSVLKHKEYDTSEINILQVWSNMLSGLINNQRKELIIEQTRRNYETFFNTIDDFLFVLDEQGNILHTNDTVISRLGYTPDELLDKSVLMLHPVERREEAGRIVGEMLDGTTDFCPVPLLAKNSSQISVETRVKPGFWDGKPVIFGVSKDVSKIRLSEEKFSKAFHSNSALMAISEVKGGRFIDANDTFKRTLGYSLDEIIGKTPTELNIYENQDISSTIYENLQKNIAVREIEIGIRKKTGEILVGLFSADYINVGNELCILAVVVDITERIQNEEEIRKAKNEAESANLAKSEFLSRMSHELRTPMNSILGFAQLMEMGELIPAHRKGVNHILKSGKHLLDLINEVLDISRIEAGRISLSMEPIRLSNVILEMIDIVLPQVTSRNQTIKLIESPENQLFVLADNQRLKQVLLNLFTNAFKYNHEGGFVQIKTELRQADSNEKPVIRISVIDNGIGIKPAEINKLFLPFERIGAEKTETEGTGLGLNVVKKLTEAMGGKVGVESNPGEGSTFWIELENIEYQKVLAESALLATNKGTPEFIKSGTILYFEDNVSNIELIDWVIENYRPQFQLVTSISGKNAVDLVKDRKPDLILLDLDLPEVHGSEVFQNLQADSEISSIPIVIISANAMSHQIKNMLKAGARDYLTKPIEIPVFLKMVDKWIDKK